MTKEEKAKKLSDWGVFLSAVSVAGIVDLMISSHDVLYWIGFVLSITAFVLCGYSLTLNPTRRMQLVFRPLIVVVRLFLVVLFDKFG